MDDDDPFGVNEPIVERPKCGKLTTKRGNPDWPDHPLSPMEPCAWPKGHEPGPCNAESVMDLKDLKMECDYFNGRTADVDGGLSM